MCLYVCFCICSICASVFGSEERGTGLLERITTDHRSLLQLQLYEVSDRDSGTVMIVIITNVFISYDGHGYKT